MTDSEAAKEIARAYYDSPDADAFYAAIWGGEDIHIGVYDEPDLSIREASRRTVLHMAEKLSGLNSGARVLDIGAGYGGAARTLAGLADVRVTCVNLSSVENERNRALTAEQGLSERVRIVEASFDDIPEPDASFDIVWSQDAILHAPDRARVLSEVARVLKSGGEFIFTDPMQADDLDDTNALRSIYERIHLADLASFKFYRSELARLGLEEISVEPMVRHMRIHYAKVREELLARQAELKGRISEDYVARMLQGLQHWVDGADAGRLDWGVLQFRRP